MLIANEYGSVARRRKFRVAANRHEGKGNVYALSSTFANIRSVMQRTKSL